MFERIGRGWGIAKASWAVVKLHPKLLLLPVFSGLAFVALMAVIGLSVLAGLGSDTVTHFVEDKKLGAPVGWALLFVFYFACTYIIIFFNAALVFCALQGFAGKEPSLRAAAAEHDTLRDRPSQGGRAGRRNGSGSLQGVAAAGRSAAPRHSGERWAASLGAADPARVGELLHECGPIYDVDAVG